MCSSDLVRNPRIGFGLLNLLCLQGGRRSSGDFWPGGGSADWRPSFSSRNAAADGTREQLHMHTGAGAVGEEQMLRLAAQVIESVGNRGGPNTH